MQWTPSNEIRKPVLSIASKGTHDLGINLAREAKNGLRKL